MPFNQRIWLFVGLSLLLFSFIAGNSEAKEPEWTYQRNNAFEVVSISEDGEYIAAADLVTMYLFNKDSSSPVWIYYPDETAIFELAISSNGEYILFSEGISTVSLFNVNSNIPIFSYTLGPDYDDSIDVIAISAYGDYFAVGSRNHKIYLFNKDKAEPLWNFSAKDGILSISISSDGEYFVVGAADNKAYFYHRDNKEP